MNTALYLDTRGIEEGTPAPLKYAIRKNAQTSFIKLGISILPKFWDKEHQQLVQIPMSRWPERPQVNLCIQKYVTTYDTTLLKMESEGRLHKLTASQIKDALLREIRPEEKEEEQKKGNTLCDAMREYIGKIENRRTSEIYTTTLRRFTALMDGAECVGLDDVTPELISRFSEQLRLNGAKSENARSIHLRNLRAVQNYAIMQGYTDNYPWKRYKIKREETVKRSMTTQELREFILAPCSKTADYYKEVFLIMFMLIGINHADLCELRHEDLRDGRIQYTRRKTHQKYDIKVEPEAMELLEKYKGRDWLIDVHDRYRDPHDQLKHFNPMLSSIIDRYPFNELTTYWARHTWATIAYNDLDIPIDTISAALGHQYGSKVTSVYINPDRKKVDVANRRMIDWVFYGRK